MSLYTISEDILSLINKLDTGDEETPIDISSVADQMSTIQGDFNDKLSSCIQYMRNMEALAESAKAEKDRIAKLQKIYENKAERIKSYIDFCLKRLGVTALDLPVAKISYRSYPAVLITDETIIPDDYKYDNVSVCIDKDKIKDAIKNDIVVPGAEIDPNVKIQIK